MTLARQAIVAACTSLVIRSVAAASHQPPAYRFLQHRLRKDLEASHEGGLIGHVGKGMPLRDGGDVVTELGVEPTVPVFQSTKSWIVALRSRRFGMDAEPCGCALLGGATCY